MPASRSLIALLVGTVVFFALWVVALKPSSKSGGSSSSQGLGAYQSDINAAHHAVASSNANDAASGNENATASSGGTAASQHGASTVKSSTAKTSSATSSTAHTGSKASAKPSTSSTAHPAKNVVANDMSTVKTAVTDHKVVALLFYNPAAADDQAVKQELASVPTHQGEVVKLAIPLNQAASFTDVTQQVPVNLSPTLVVISRSDDANEIVGYTAPFVIDQQVDDALSTG